jgi:hypothetical protein
MATIKIKNDTISDTVWGDVDKSALGNALAEAYAAGNATKAVIREAYAFVPDDAFDEDADGEPTFAYTKAWGPHHELDGSTLVLNSNGVSAAAAAAAGARSEPDLSTTELDQVKEHLRRHYIEHLDEEVPEGLEEMKRRVSRGHPLEELVKGSLDYTMHRIRRAFYAQFNDRSVEANADGPYAWIEEIFSDHVIATSDALPVDEYYYIAYRREGGDYVFASRDEWEVVELTYQPKTMLQESRAGEPQRFVEVVNNAVSLVESQGDGGRWIEGTGITADVVNGNGRRYPRHVLREAVERLQGHLHESAGQGRLGQMVTGEAEHPTSKGSFHPQFLETIVNWNAGYVKLDEATGRVQVRGRILETSKGKDAIVIMEGGVMPGLSMRGYGSSVVVEEDGRSVEEVTALTITGFDLLSPGMNSDPNSGITLFESRTFDEEDEMSELNLELLREKYPDLVDQIIQEHDAKKKAELEEALARKAEEDKERQKLLAEHDRNLRQVLGLSETDDLEKALEERERKLQELEKQEQARKVTEYIEEQCDGVNYVDFLKKQFVEAVKNAKPGTVEEAKQVIVAKRAEYDAIQSEIALRNRGFQVMGPVIERDLGIPAFARAGYALQESLVRAGQGRQWKPNDPRSLNEQFAALYLNSFDKQYQRQLVEEAQMFEEAEIASDLNLPYSVTRAVIAEAFPELVATSIFDFGMMERTPSRLYYEAYSGETGYTATVTDEEVTADSDTYVALDYKRITPGTVVVTTDPAGTTYTEGSDYVVDYANGEIMALSGGDISDGASLLVDYSYTAIRQGEMVAIERGEVNLTYKTIEAAADRLATQISKEAIVFSRSQIGWDATTRTISSLVRQIQRKIDQGIFYMALASALQIASNSGGTWTAATDELDALVQYIGQAKVKVANRFYTPTGVLGSTTTMDRLSNWDGFKRDGFPDAVLNASGFVGRVKGLPAFESTEFSDSYLLIVNRELVMHRVYQTMQIMGPFPTYDVSNSTSKLIAADQYYAEEFNATESPVPQKGAYVKIA